MNESLETAAGLFAWAAGLISEAVWGEGGILYGSILWSVHVLLGVLQAFVLWVLYGYFDMVLTLWLQVLRYIWEQWLPEDVQGALNYVYVFFQSGYATALWNVVFYLLDQLFYGAVVVTTFIAFMAAWPMFMVIRFAVTIADRVWGQSS